MPETYTNGLWIVKSGEEDAFIRRVVRVAGRVESSGKANGELRVRFIDGQGFPCDSRLRKWKAG